MYKNEAVEIGPVLIILVLALALRKTLHSFVSVLNSKGEMTRTNHTPRLLYVDLSRTIMRNNVCSSEYNPLFGRRPFLLLLCCNWSDPRSWCKPMGLLFNITILQSGTKEMMVTEEALQQPGAFLDRGTPIRPACGLWTFSFCKWC